MEKFGDRLSVYRRKLLNAIVKESSVVNNSSAFEYFFADEVNRNNAGSTI